MNKFNWFLTTILLINFSSFQSKYHFNSFNHQDKNKNYISQKHNFINSFEKRKIKRLENELENLKIRNDKLHKKNLHNTSHYEKKLLTIRQKNRKFANENVILKRENLRYKWKIKKLKEKKNPSKNFFAPYFNNRLPKVNIKEKHHFYSN